MKKISARKIGAGQKRTLWLVLGSCFGLAALLFSFFSEEEEKMKTQELSADPFQGLSEKIDPEAVRISVLEKLNDTLAEKLELLEQSLSALHEESMETQELQNNFSEETLSLSHQIKMLEEKLQESAKPLDPLPQHTAARQWKVWGNEDKKEGKHVAFEIPAGTVVKAVLVSGADCSVAVQKPTGPNMVLLRPLDNGHLPRNVRVPLKGSVIIGSAIGDISSERVYIRAERMSLIERDGAFSETDLSAYISGEDGREGMRGVVVDRSGQIVARAAFAAFLQGASQGAQTALQTKAFEHMSQKVPGLEGLHYGPIQGTTTALNKMTDYYIKRAEQLQPAIQIAAGRVVDVIFTKSVKIGEKDLKKKLDLERAAKRESHA